MCVWAHTSFSPLLCMNFWLPQVRVHELLTFWPDALNHKKGMGHGRGLHKWAELRGVWLTSLRSDPRPVSVRYVIFFICIPLHFFWLWWLEYLIIWTVFLKKIYTIFTCNMLLIVFCWFITIISRRHVRDCRLGPETVIFLLLLLELSSCGASESTTSLEEQNFSSSDGANAAAALCTAHPYVLVWSILKEH